MPLIVLLHGCKQTASSFAQGTRMNRLAQAHGFVFAIPNSRPLTILSAVGVGLIAATSAVMRKCELSAKWYAPLWQTMKRSWESIADWLIGWSEPPASMLAANYPDEFALVALHSGPVLNKAHNTSGEAQVMADREVESDACLLRFLHGFTPKRFYIIGDDYSRH